MSLADIISKLKDDDFTIVDDHTGKEEKLAGAGLYCNASGEALELVGMFDAMYYSTNRLYLNTDGKIHLSRTAVGPVVWTDAGKHLVQEANDQQIFGAGIPVAFYADGSIEEYEIGRGSIRKDA